MLDRTVAETLLLKHLAWIEKVSFVVCAKRGIWGADAQDFAAWTKIKLMEDDYARIRKFRGDANITTYLVTLVVRSFSEYQRALHGRWRASAAAERLGPPAIELESLVYRDGYSVASAGEQLRMQGRTLLSDIELARLLAKLPNRSQLRPIEVRSEWALVASEALSKADELVTGAEADAQRRELLSALERALDSLNPEDAKLLRMHYSEGQSLSELAIVLSTPLKEVSHRLTVLSKSLRAQLERDGVTARDVRVLLESGGFEAPLAKLIVDQNEPQDFEHPGILGPDGLPIRAEDLQGSRIITDIVNTTEKLVSMVRNDPKRLQDLTPREFEYLVAELLEEQGYSVVLTPPSKDGGFDMYAARKDGLGEFMYLVECKRYALSNPVGVDVVRALSGVVQMKRASAGIVVTTSRFTKGAIEFQKCAPHQLSLRDYLHLQNWLGPNLIRPPFDTTL